MQQTELVGGFSELKDLLIKTYRIERPQELVRLYFTAVEDELLMHDYNDHAKLIGLGTIERPSASKSLSHNASKVVRAALETGDPVFF
ncbi:MAG: hypothetical protein H7328_05640 [Bdellovibrio sp.]|nr:hypothetical protein [Bdellovibrio sp.]